MALDRHLIALNNPNTIRKSSPGKNFGAMDLTYEHRKPWQRTPKQRLSDLTKILEHKPTPIERNNLRLPHNVNTLSILEPKYFLMLCGGNNHIQFKIEEMDEINRLLKQLEIKYYELKVYFHALTDSQIKHTLHPRLIKTATTDSFTFNPDSVRSGMMTKCQHSSVDTGNVAAERDVCAECHRISMYSLLMEAIRRHKKTNVKEIELLRLEKDEYQSEGIGEGRAVSDVPSSPASPILESVLQALHIHPPSPPTYTDQVVIGFHVKADAVMASLGALQSIVRQKYRDRPGFKVTPDDNEPFDRLPRQPFIQVLIDMYAKAVLNPRCGTSDGSKRSKSEVKNRKTDVLPSIGRISAFLSCCVVCPCMLRTHEEKAALCKLLHASQDSNCIISDPTTDNIESFSSKHTQKYWARRIFDFF
mmetsp:Transcript_15044/g.22633  ORF Transcript_15044/g.22633 Transcript_15044/m.22633 type:complete len:418 (-) Transcript_15044:175-1428(-)